MAGSEPWAWTPSKTLDDPRTMGQRRARARQFAAAEAIDVPILVDSMDDAAATAYDALPDRIFLIGPKGGLRYVGGIGPEGFHPEEIEPLLRREPMPSPGS